MPSFAGRAYVMALVVLVLAAAGGWYVLGRSAKAGDAGGPKGPAAPPLPPVPVTAANVEQRDMPVYLDGLGTVQAFNTVTLRSQIDGLLIGLPFKEGQEIHKGDVLAQIDPQPYQAQLEQAQAKKKQDEAKILQDQAKTRQDQAKIRQDQAKQAQDEANLVNARLNLKRYQETLAKGASTEQSVTDQQSMVTQLEATIQADVAGIQADEAAVQSDEVAPQVDAAIVQADEAAIKYEQTLLAYTSIASPMDGRIGIRLVDSGNVIHATDPNGIVSVTQLEPISVIFTLPQQDLVAINERMAKERLPVIATAGAGKTEMDRGVLELVDNQIDSSTGTIRLKATFPNTQRKLWPGGFVNVRLLLDTRRGATVVPAPAVQQGPDGNFVYLIKPDETVEPRPVTVASIQDGQALLESGASAGDLVVLAGQDRLKAGTHISVNRPSTDAAGKQSQPERKKKPGASGRPEAAQ